MSTKIYNGFRMKNLPATELVVFINTLREKIRPKIYDAFCEGIVQICRKLVYTALKYNAQMSPDSVSELEEKFLRSWYAASLTGPTAVQKALYPIDKIIEDLDYPFIGGVLDLAINIYRNDTLQESYQSCYNDIRSNIAFLKGCSDDRLLFITYGNIFTDYLYELIKTNDEFVSKYCIEEYGYWNNTDPPEGVTDEEWAQREQDWNQALPGPGIPSRCGLCTAEILDPEQLFSIFRICADGRLKKIKALMPSIDAIAEDAARNNINSKRIYENNYDIIGFLEEHHKREKDDPEVQKGIQEYKTRLLIGIPDLSDLEISILKFLPNYVKWREEVKNA